MSKESEYGQARYSAARARDEAIAQARKTYKETRAQIWEAYQEALASIKDAD